MIMAIVGGLLGVPLWLMLGWLAAALWHRRETNQLPDVFDLKVRMVSGTYRHTGDSFPRMKARGLWAHDILIIEKGRFIPRTLHFKVMEGIRAPQPADPEEVKGLGESPVTMQYRLDDGGVIEIATSSEELPDERGPFFDSGSPRATGN